jgi:hypothetical protein
MNRIASRSHTGLALLLSLVGLGPLLSGCSIAMAMHGQQEPNFEAFDVGSTRKQVEIQLGTPVQTQSIEDGKKEDTYRFEMGNSPNPARATLYFYYDLATLGLAEPIFSLIEVFQGHTEESRITYDTDDHVIGIQGYTPPQPTPSLKQAMEAQEPYKKKASVVTQE